LENHAQASCGPSAVFVRECFLLQHKRLFVNKGEMFSRKRWWGHGFFPQLPLYQQNDQVGDQVDEGWDCRCLKESFQESTIRSTDGNHPIKNYKGYLD